MKKPIRSMMGVTLIEVMLVLAIAAMIIVMSIRYYQSATSASQANTVMQQIQAITSAADSIASGQGYTALGNDPSTAIKNLLPANGLVTPWGGAISISNATGTSYDVKIANVPVAVCTPLTNKLATNTQFTSVSTCGNTAATVTYTYNITAVQ